MIDSTRREPGGYRYGPYPRYWVERDRRDEFFETTDIHRCIWAWRRHVSAALAAAEHLDDHRDLQVRYESLLDNSPAVGERLLGFLGIDEPASREALLDHLSLAHPRSIGQWKEHLVDDQLAHINREAGELLRQLGYCGNANEVIG